MGLPSNAVDYSEFFIIFFLSKEIAYTIVACVYMDDIK